jgi:hypothetical protein
VGKLEKKGHQQIAESDRQNEQWESRSKKRFKIPVLSAAGDL